MKQTTYGVSRFPDQLQLINVKVFILGFSDEINDQLSVVDVMNLGPLISSRPVSDTFVLPQTHTHHTHVHTNRQTQHFRLSLVS